MIKVDEKTYVNPAHIETVEDVGDGCTRICMRGRVITLERPIVEVIARLRGKTSWGSV